MFKKPFKVKTSSIIKGSERRRLRSLIESSFPNLSSEEIGQLLSNKDEIRQTKAMTHSGSVLMIYYIGQNPMFFQVENLCYPTVFTLWKYPHLLPTIVTLPPVLPKIINGADLMAPGVVITDSTLHEMTNLEVNKLCSIRIIGNMTPIAVGCAVMSKGNLCTDGVKGKAVVIAQSYKDTLWLSGDQSDLPIQPEKEDDVLLPTVDAVEPEETLDTIDTQECQENFTDLSINENEILGEVIAEESDDVEFTMDEILHHSFLTAIKMTGKKIELPILTSIFYSAHVLKCCPSSLHLDIKKTSYKKLSTFLKKMQKEKVIQMKELSKGVESIVSINLNCDTVKHYHIIPFFKDFVVAEKEKILEEEPTENGIGPYTFPLVTELFVISAQVKILFEKFKLKKGDTISSSIIRDILRRYVKENSLQSENNKNEVILDPILSDCICMKGDQFSTMTWEDLHNAITHKMPHAYEVKFEGQDAVVKKGKLEPITVTVDTRTGNKKVTLVHNLETFGINYDKFAHHVQVAVAASTSIYPTQNGKGIIVLIQGNQLQYLQKLFIESYKVPRKYLQGLENIPKKKK